MWGLLLDTTLIYQRLTPAPDGAGGTVKTPTQILAAMPCTVQSASTSTILRYAERGITVGLQIFTTLDLNQSIANGGVGGVRIDDVLTDGTTKYIVHGFRRDQNVVLSPEPLYQLDVEQVVLP